MSILGKGIFKLWASPQNVISEEYSGYVMIGLLHFASMRELTNIEVYPCFPIA
jgi:hypothetical protein